MCVLTPQCAVDLLRLVWSDDIVDGKVQPSAFRKEDLETKESFVSVDRLDELVPAAIREVERGQKERAQAGRREDSFGAYLNAGRVRAIRDRKQQTPLEVYPAKLPGNDAHCAIANGSGTKSKTYVQVLRTELAAAVMSVRPLDEILREHGEVPAGE